MLFIPKKAGIITDTRNVLTYISQGDGDSRRIASSLKSLRFKALIPTATDMDWRVAYNLTCPSRRLVS